MDMLTQPSCPDPAIQNWLLSRGGRVIRIDPSQAGSPQGPRMKNGSTFSQIPPQQSSYATHRKSFLKKPLLDRPPPRSCRLTHLHPSPKKKTTTGNPFILIHSLASDAHQGKVKQSLGRSSKHKVIHARLTVLFIGDWGRE